MYIPETFAETETARLQAPLRENGFATHLPLLPGPGRGPKGASIGHMAGADPLGRGVAASMRGREPAEQG